MLLQVCYCLWRRGCKLRPVHRPKQQHITYTLRNLERRNRGERVPLAAITMHLVNALKKMRRVGSKEEVSLAQDHTGSKHAIRS